MGWQDDPVVSSQPAWMNDPVVKPAARSFDLVNGESVPTGSAYARAAYSPVAQPDPNSTHPVDSEIGAILENARAGAGKAFVDLGRGVGQYLGLTSRQDVAESRKLDTPLMNTTAGKVGNIVGNAALAAPTAAIPGANTVTGAGLIGAGIGALQPSTSTGETLRNTAVGGALGAAGQYVGNKVADLSSQIIASRAAKAQALEEANSVRDATLREAQANGYVTPPTLTNPSLTNTALESASGRYATKQGATITNQKVTNGLAAGDLNITGPVTPKALNDVRSAAGQVYAEVKRSGVINAGQDGHYLDDLAKITNVSDQLAQEFPGANTPAAAKINSLVDSLSQDKFSAAGAVEYTKRLRQQAAANFKYAARSADPEVLALAQAQSKGAEALENAIGRHLDSQGKSSLLDAFQEARTRIAKSYNLEAALNSATGNVDARVLAAQLDRGVKLSGGMLKAAKFAQAFSEVAGEPVKGPAVSKLAFASAAGGALTGHPELLALPAASWVARKTLLSPVVNRALATPGYAPNALGTLTLEALKQSPRAVLPATAATLPLIEANQ